MSLRSVVAQLEEVVAGCDAEIAVLLGACDEAVRGFWLERDIAVQAIELLDNSRVVEPLRLSCSFLAAVIAVVQTDEEEERGGEDAAELEASVGSSFVSVVEDGDGVEVTTAADQMPPGFDMVSSLVGPAGPKGPGRKYDYAEIAAVAREALAERKLAGPAVSVRFGVPVAYATQMITRARNAGHDIPLRHTGATAAAGELSVDPAPVKSESGSVLGCQEDGCDWVCEVFEVRKMLRHTDGAHGRRTSISERTPRPR